MAMGQWWDEGVQGKLLLTTADFPTSPGHAFYDKQTEFVVERGGVRSVRRTDVSKFLRKRCEGRSAEGAAGGVFSDAVRGLLRRRRLATRHRLALCGPFLVAFVLGTVVKGAGAGPFVAFEDSQAVAGVGARGGVCLGVETVCGQAPADGPVGRGRRFDDDRGECVDAFDRAEGDEADVSRIREDADAGG